jgi:NitT/TauT family transport system permease protein
MSSHVTTPEPETTTDPPPPPTTKRMSESTEKWLWRAGTFIVVVAVLGVWELLPRMGIVNDIILPPATEVISAIGTLWTSETFPEHFRVTLWEMLLGFIIGTVVGLVSGIALGVSNALYKLTYPLVVAFQSIPKIVLAPLLITWFGYGMSSKVAMAVIISFFPVLINTIVGLESVPEEPLKLMRSLRASKWQIFYKLSLPTAAPIMFAGIKTALTFAVIGAIVAEFIGSSQGLGYLLNVYSFQLRIDMVFAVIVTLSVMGSVLYFLIDWADRKLIFWRSDTVR